MKYRVLIAHEAEKILDGLDRPTERRVRARFNRLVAVDPFDARLSAPLTERPGVRKPRVGGWKGAMAWVRHHEKHIDAVLEKTNDKTA